MAFQNQTIVVTGAAGSLGRSVAENFHAAGAQVVLVDKEQGLLDSHFPDEDPRYAKVAVDLLDPVAVLAAFAQIQAAYDGIDALCAIAGGFHMGEPVHDTPADKWDTMYDLNVRTLLHSVHAIVPPMIARGSGKIVTVGANAALKGVPGMGAYCASKSTVMRLTEAMAGELRDKSININCVLPSIIDTPVNRADMPDTDAALWVAPSDLASVFMFLCSPGARAIHGALIPVVGLS
ncbi:MAG: SDR family NAD(P)-dependent oxidoreductase [Proteobacteria bacterium]|nr:SDR family NAD(P)-dependent oxidoreductase [Pseudomonadota bacterium]